MLKDNSCNIIYEGISLKWLRPINAQNTEVYIIYKMDKCHVVLFVCLVYVLVSL